MLTGAHAGWVRFDAVAGHWLGLDNSKYEWAHIEKELEEHNDLEALANDGVQLLAKAAALEHGPSTSEIVKDAPIQLQSMSRMLPHATGHAATEHGSATSV
jgi:hypothetical protein